MNEVEKLRLYAELLQDWTLKVNLIGPEARRNLDAHIAEAIAAADLLRPEGKVLDFGSGGGLPAIPMAIRSPKAQFHLVEADVKKWSFLKFAIRRCELNCVVHGDRLRAVVDRFDAGLRFSLVTSRAVGQPEEWIPVIEPHLESAARVALFESSPEPVRIEGFHTAGVDRLPRGESNYLITLQRST